MAKTRAATVGSYLTKRLEDAGVKHIFGVPGDYVLVFFKCLEASNIKVIGTCNELNAGYAADAYARVNGIGAACVTYGVGGFSLLNAAVGAYAERVPLVVISGSPKVGERAHHHLLHHTIGDMDLQRRIYEEVAAASVVLTDPHEAPRMIDETLTACLRQRRPVYIELPADIVRAPCAAPGPFRPDTRIPSDAAALKEAVAEAAAILKKAKRPVILAGVEAHRLGIRDELKRIVDHAGCPFATTMLGKSVLSERHPQFVGVYYGAVSPDRVRGSVESADMVLSLGALMTDFNMGMWTSKLDASRMIVANSDKARIRHHVYSHVSLEDFMKGLRAALPKDGLCKGRRRLPPAPPKKEYLPEPSRKLTLSRFYERVNRFIEEDSVIISDTGDSILNASELHLPKDDMFIGQAFYLSIGYAVPAALGAGLAARDRRAIVFVGDGAFQMTAQELSTIIRNGLNPVIFLINNDGYTIERVIHEGPFNDLQQWKYHELPRVFGGGWGCEVKTEGELEDALRKAKREKGSAAFIEVRLARYDCSEGLKRLGKALRG